MELLYNVIVEIVIVEYRIKKLCNQPNDIS